MVDLCLSEPVPVVPVLAHLEALDPHGHVSVELLLGFVDQLLTDHSVFGGVHLPQIGQFGSQWWKLNGRVQNMEIMKINISNLNLFVF